MIEILHFLFEDRAIQDVMSRLNIEPDVRAVSWEKLQQ
jgi:hypothetical protein